MKLTEAERQHAIARDKFFSGPFSTPQTQASAIRHLEGVKELVSVKPNPQPSQLLSWQRSPWD